MRFVDGTCRKLPAYSVKHPRERAYSSKGLGKTPFPCQEIYFAEYMCGCGGPKYMFIINAYILCVQSSLFSVSATTCMTIILISTCRSTSLWVCCGILCLTFSLLPLSVLKSLYRSYVSIQLGWASYTIYLSSPLSNFAFFFFNCLVLSLFST